MKSTFADNELAVIEPEVAVFLKTDIVFEPEFVITISGLPSPSISPIAIKYGYDPVAKSTLLAKEPDEIEPEVLVFLKT